jgi:prephenate dehydrogenase
MPNDQITIIGTGLIGGSLALALKKQGFAGRIVGCDRAQVLDAAKAKGAIDEGFVDPHSAIQGSQVIVLAVPIAAIIHLIRDLGPSSAPNSLFTDVGSTKMEVLNSARQVFGENVSQRFMGTHPMVGKENAGIEFADADLFRNATWFITPVEDRAIQSDLPQEYLSWIGKTGANIAVLDAVEHDELCAWISHLPQFVATALAATLIEEYGDEAPLLETGGRALREMTRVANSPYAMWRDIAITNKENIQNALSKLEQRLAHIRENLDSRELAKEFECAQKLKLRAKRAVDH